MAQIDPQFLEMLICPVTRSRLTVDGDQLVSEVGGLRYPIRHNIPVLLADEAQLPEGVADLDAFKKKFNIAP
jgi:hypothetical protein